MTPIRPAWRVWNSPPVLLLTPPPADRVGRKEMRISSSKTAGPLSAGSAMFQWIARWRSGKAWVWLFTGLATPS
jgi:hypothetical protein